MAERSTEPQEEQAAAPVPAPAQEEQPQAPVQELPQTQPPSQPGSWMGRASAAIRHALACFATRLQHLLYFMQTLRAVEPESPTAAAEEELRAARSGCGGCALGKSNFLVVIDGNIGTGKSALLQKLQEKHGHDDAVRFFQEEAGSWAKHLGTLYDALRSPQEKIPESLLQTLAEGEAAIFDSRKDGTRNEQRPVIVERSVRTSAQVFGPELAARGLLPAGGERGGLAWLQEQYKQHSSDAANCPDLTIYLKCDIGEAASRIQKRAEEARPTEIGMPREYLEALQQRYDAMYPEEGPGSEGMIRVDTTGKASEEVAAEVENVLAAELSKAVRRSFQAEKADKATAAGDEEATASTAAAAKGGA